MSELAVITGQETNIIYKPFGAIMPQFNTEWYNLFIDCMAANDNNTTLKGYITCIRQFEKWRIDNGIMQPCAGDVAAYKAQLQAADYTAGTRAQYFRAVKQFFKWTAAHNLYPDITFDIKGMKVSQDTHKKDALRREDVPQIAETIDRNTEQGKRMYALYMLCVDVGLRMIEVSRANVEDVETINGTTYLYIQGKGHTEKDTKKAISKEAGAALRDYLQSRTDAAAAKSPLFVSTSNRSKGQRIDPSTIGQEVKKMLRAAGFDSKRITAHSLRHTSGTGAYEATHNLFIAQKHQRHADPKTTEIYIHAQEAEKMNTAQQVHDYYFKADAQTDAATEAGEIMRQLPAEKQKAALDMLRAML